MDSGTELFLHQEMATNNNPAKKKWSAPTINLGSVDEYSTEVNYERRESTSSGGSRRGSSTSGVSGVSGVSGIGLLFAPHSRRQSASSAASVSSGRRDSTPSVGGGGVGGLNLLGLDEKGAKGRRRSWHVAKLERKRRKGVISPAHSDSEKREKRPSWWNIFVPDNLKNRSSRRASVAPEVTQPPTYVVPYQRSKSRSVDHGFSPPFDLDSLRHSVEGRMQSAEKLARADSDGAGGSSRDPAEKKMGRHLQPLNTITYTVKASDTLTSVAARFDTTPSELAKMNRLATRLVFPGQVLYVPDKRPAGSTTSPSSLEAQDSEGQEEGDAASPKPTAEGEGEGDDKDGNIPSGGPGRAERIGHNIHAPTRSRDLERFLKITVRHITDGQGVVSGVLLVTPNAVMFDPNVSDQLVIEHGPESYGVIAPMEFVVNAAIYYDIAHMRVGNTDAPTGDVAKPEIYHPKESQTSKEGESHSAEDNSISPGKESLLVKDETFPELAPGRSSTEDDDAVDNENGDNESECSCPAGREGSAFPKAFERDLVTPTNLTVSQNTSRQTSMEENIPHDISKDTSLEEKKDGERSISMESSGDEAYTMIRKMEERRMSSLDHHWAVPKQKGSQDSKDGDGEVVNKNKDETCDLSAAMAEGFDERRGNLVKSSCHDSGIDIRDADQPPLPIIIPCTKKVFSDADIIMASKNDFVPPITVAPTNYLTETQQQQADDTGITSGAMLAAAPVSRKKTSSVSFSVEDEGKEGKENKEEDQDKQESRKNKMLKRLSYPLAWMEGFTGDKDEKDSLPGLPSSADSQSQHSSVFSKVFSRRSSVGTFIGRQQTETKEPKERKPPAPKLDIRSMVDADEMPDLFRSIDQLIPQPARSCEDPPLYLRLRMGKPVNRKIPKSTPIMSYGKKKMRPEYWFGIPRNRVDDLYKFLHLWVPHLYGDLEDMDYKSRGFELVESDTELWDDEAGSESQGEGGRRGSDEGELGELTRESWELVSMSEELRRALYATNSGSFDIEVLVPDLVGVTEIFTEDHRKELCRHLPARAEGYVWTLVFSTSQHGFSLNSMYRKMQRLESPILLVIQDTENNVFGALTSCALKVSDHFYGTGESLLFRFQPQFQVYNWTGDNMYFIKGNNESLAIGAGDGRFGLWLDGDLYQGRSQSCSTYGNDPLSINEDFVVKTLECWAFI